MPNNDPATLEALLAALPDIQRRLDEWLGQQKYEHTKFGLENEDYRARCDASQDDIAKLLSLVNALQQQNAFLAMESKKYQEGWDRCMNKLLPETVDEDVPTRMDDDV